MTDLWLVLVGPGLLTCSVAAQGQVWALLQSRPSRAMAVLAHRCDLSGTQFQDVGVFSPGGKALSEWPSEKDAWQGIATEASQKFPDRLARVRRAAEVASLSHFWARNLTVFQDLSLDFCPGINVFLGTNGTGKTHLLKALYASLHAARGLVREQGETTHLDELQLRIRQKLIGTFRPSDGDLDRLLRVHRTPAEYVIGCQEGSLKVSFLGVLTNVDADQVPCPKSTLFIPSREGLSLFEGFIAAYDARELSVDETYCDLCVALSASRLKGKAAEEASALLADLGDVLGGEVELRGGRFSLKQAGSGREVEAHQLAEGLRKLASLVQLIRNGSLTRDTILFWDEPEASLNPKLAEKVVQVLLRLAAQGVQIFLATHDYLIAHRLSLAAEYKTNPGVSMKFFSFWRPDPERLDAPVQMDSGETLAAIDHDPILEEYLAFAAREEALQARALDQG